MSRLSEKLRLRLLLVRPTKFLSQKLACLSLATLHLCKSLARALASKTLAIFTMDDLFSSAIEDDLWDIDSRYRFRPQRRLLGDDYDDGADNSTGKVYLVPYRYLRIRHFSFLFLSLFVCLTAGKAMKTKGFFSSKQWWI